MVTHIPARVQVGWFFRTVLPGFAVLVIAIGVGLGYVVYRLTHPGSAPELVSPSNYLIPSVDVSWPSDGERDLSGWWIPGKDGAPVVVLVPGYGMGRSDVLSLAAAIHGRGLHVLAFDMRGQGADPKGPGSLGLGESADVTSALEYAAGRPHVDGSRLGIWGVDVGARAALAAAAPRPEVRALAVDSPFDTVAEFFSIRLYEEFGPAARFLEYGAMQAFRAYMLARSDVLQQPLQLERMADRSILFLQGENRQALARTAGSLYNRLEPRKEMVSLPCSRVRVMNGDDLKNYDRQVANFFQLNLAALPGERPGNAQRTAVK